MINKFKSFHEYLEETNENNIDYADYISSRVEPSVSNRSYAGIVAPKPKQTWSMENKHPWTREQYEKLAHPDVKKDISYDTYLNMWNVDVNQVIKQPTPKRKAIRNRSSYGTGGVAYGTSGAMGTSGRLGGGAGGAGGDVESYPGEAREKLQELVGQLHRKPVARAQAKPTVKTEEEIYYNKSVWSRLKLDTKIMIIIMIVGIILSFITVLLLM